MRKMTYKQAATCGEKLKARVTHEQSEKMQRAWFANGKAWADDLTEISDTDNPYLILDEVYGLDCCSKEPAFYDSSEKMFLSCSNEQIELIDDLPQHNFASQLEVIAWLVVGEKAIHTENQVTVGFKDGVLWDFTLDRKCILNFFDFESWKRYTQPRLIRNFNGIEVPAPLESKAQ